MVLPGEYQIEIMNFIGNLVHHPGQAQVVWPQFRPQNLCPQIQKLLNRPQNESMAEVVAFPQELDLYR